MSFMNLRTRQFQTAEHQSSNVNSRKSTSPVKSSDGFKDNRSETVLQREIMRMANESSLNDHQAGVNQANRTGLTDQLKENIEVLSGYSMDDVKVHYNSYKPAQLNAYAFAQGTQIYLGPGQEKHLPHEAWHVVQQKQGRVKPTVQMKGTYINEDQRLEKEADRMGVIVQNMPVDNSTKKNSKNSSNLHPSLPTIIQRNGEQLLGIILDNPEFQKVVGNQPAAVKDLRLVSRRIKTKVDKNFVNPNTWAVLHSLREQSFQKLGGALGAKGDVKSSFERTGSKYDPTAYGDDYKHTWFKNAEWLKNICQQFDNVVLTALPLDNYKILRRPENIRHGPKLQFSALAREIAYLFLYGNFRVRNELVEIDDYPVQYLAKIRNVMADLVSEHKEILQLILNGDATKLEPGLALHVFGKLGIMIKQDGTQDYEAKLQERKDEKNTDLMKIIN